MMTVREKLYHEIKKLDSVDLLLVNFSLEEIGRFERRRIWRIMKPWLLLLTILIAFWKIFNAI